MVSRAQDPDNLTGAGGEDRDLNFTSGRCWRSGETAEGGQTVRSTYHYQLKASALAGQRANLYPLCSEAFGNRRCYGYKRIHLELKKRGHHRVEGASCV